MPVPLLVPILGAMAGTIAGPALGLGAAAAAGGAAAGGIGGLLASAAPAALGAGIATLAAGGDPREALMNAALGGAGAAAMPAVTGALQGMAGAGAQKAAVEAVRTPVQAAASPTAASLTSAAPTASLRPMARPEGLASAAASPFSSFSAQDLLKLSQTLGGGGSQPQPRTQGPMSTPQVSQGRPVSGGQTPMVGGSPMMTPVTQQPSTPTAADYIGQQTPVSPPIGSMSMMPEEEQLAKAMPASLNVGLGALHPQQQNVMPNNAMLRGFA